MKTNHFYLYLNVLGFIISPIVYAHDNQETLFNQVHLHAQAEREISNDQMTVILAAEHEGAHASELADQINKDMQWALNIIKKVDSIESKTRNYQMYPVYKKQVIISWRGSQQLELKSDKIDGLSELVGKLQDRLLVKQMNFNPTEKTRKQNEDELIEEALQAFKSRITLVQKHMDNKSHRIVSINIDTGRFQPPIAFEARSMMQSMEKKASPAVQPGTSKITVTVSGSVQFF